MPALPDLPDLPAPVQERVVCSIGAAVRYNVPVNVLIAVAEQEGGRPGQWVANSNGTRDIGSLQFNSAYVRTLARYGITPQDVAAPGINSQGKMKQIQTTYMFK